MRDVKIGLSVAIAAGAWMLALIGLVLVWVDPDRRVGFTTIMLMGVAANLTNRALIIQQCVSLRNAFELGKDSQAHPIARVLRRD